MKPLRIFLSGTYFDLKNYREAAKDALLSLNDFPVSMDFFGASESEPTTLSLEKLDECDAYVGIIGHRYGTVPDPRDGRSITHREYDHACEIRKKRHFPMFLFLAEDDAAPVPPKLMENDELREKLRVFRGMLEARHVPSRFSNTDELKFKIVTDFRRRVEDLKKSGIRIFEEEEASSVFESVEGGSEHREATIREMLSFIARLFDGVFRFEHSDLESHPFFTNMAPRLKAFIPGVSVDESTGILKRANIRHIILRTRTIHQIIEHMEVCRLKECGEAIGKEAAADLVQKVLRDRKAVPSSPRAFVELWDYWDSTGGWGKIELILEQDLPEEIESKGVESDDEWYLRVLNSFLMVEGELEKTHSFSGFWAGYIQGFLNEALPAIDEMMRDLTEEERLRVTLPAYHRVVDVEHLPDSTIEQDIFRITFEERPYSRILSHLAHSSEALRQGQYVQTVLNMLVALHRAKNEFSEEKVLAVAAELSADDVGWIRDALRGDFSMSYEDLGKDETVRIHELAKKVIDTLCK